METQIATPKNTNQPLLTDGSSKANESKRTYIIWFITIALLLIFAVVIGIVFNLFESSSTDSEKICKYDRKLIMISLDGFRSEYFENTNISTPNLHFIKDSGVHIKRLLPVFPSVTLPSHYSIVTGLYPGDHGIVSNWFWDPVLQEQFTMQTKDIDGKWYKGEPIWLTHRMPKNIETFGNIFKSASISWVGSYHNVSGLGYPDFYLPYNDSYPYNQRVDHIVNLLKSNEYRIILGYFEQPDSMGHEFGPNSNEVHQAVEEMDALIGCLMDKIRNESMELFENTDIIITSDHGMAETSMERLIFINATQTFDLWNDNINFRLEGVGIYMFIKLTEISNFTVNQVMDLLREVIYPLDGVGIYNKDNIPFKYSSGYHYRIADIMVTIPVGYQFYFNGIDENEQGWLNTIGHHGYNNSHIDMSSLFVARGPSFKVNYTKEMVENIHLYPMLCQIMCKMIPSPNNGSLHEIEDILN